LEVEVVTHLLASGFAGAESAVGEIAHEICTTKQNQGEGGRDKGKPNNQQR
jgi:hypothetical protein